MKIDAHMHVNFKKWNLNDIITYLDKNQFDCCWLMTWEEVDPGGWRYDNLCISDVFSAFKKYPSRIVPMYAPDPYRPDAAEQMLRWHEKGIRGCAELKSTVNWSSDSITRLLTAVAQLEIPVVFHMEGSNEVINLREVNNTLEHIILRLTYTNRLFGLSRKVFDILSNYYQPLAHWKEKRTFVFPGYMLDFASLEARIQQFPEIPFIGHGPLFWQHISKEPFLDEGMHPKGPVLEGGLTCSLLRTYPNLFADISGNSGLNALKRDPEFTRKFIDEFAHKIIFGSDNTRGHADVLNNIDLSSEKIGMIYGGNAAKLASV
jgi:uncharacterized protein